MNQGPDLRVDSGDLMTIITTLFLIAVVFFVKTAIVVPTRMACVVERLGKFRDVLTPGLHILIPFVDRIAHRHEMREQIIDVLPQHCITRDNIQVMIDGLLYLKVLDPRRASYGIAEYRKAAANLAQTTLRSELGKLTLHQTFSERENLNHTVVAEVDKASEPWGIKVMRYEIMNIVPSTQVIHTLEKQMEAERTRRSEVTIATAEKEALSFISEGERQEVINISEGAREKRINEAQGRAAEIALLADASAKGIEMVARAIAKPGGEAAVRMQLVENYIGELGKLLGQCQVTMMPSAQADIKTLMEGAARITQHQAGTANSNAAAAKSRLAPAQSGGAR
jgi:regulator of protease activity HflC (stomatin/prohibitin superfamily)